MPLQPGKKLGPYEIVALLGAGGMGEVYRAKDDRLGRQVAVKVLPPSFARDRDRLQRFEQEARAAGQLNHSNVMAVYDVGVSEGTPYLVSELLEGESLREALAPGPLPPRKAVEFGVQIANGLAAAHAKGIVHRDLKPENLFVLRDGSVKILDFGLAKLMRENPEDAGDGGTRHYAMTASGEILGTASYMSPEQVRAKAADHRTDLFAMGAILFEMLTAQKAFPGETPADRMSAILHADPPDLPEAVLAAVPGIDSVIRRCLEKKPESRIDSARDLAFALELLLGVASPGKRGAAAAAMSGTPASELLIRRLTFREGAISGARFAPDGQTVIYSAAWEGKPPELYEARVGSPESRAMGIEQADLLSVSSAGELAISLKARDVGGFVRLGTLARMPLIGGVPRALLDDVFQADWSPDGKSMAVIRDVEGAARIEYPIGKVLYEAPGWASHPRVSPDGKWVAFCDHPDRGDNAGGIAVVDLEGRVRHLAEGFSLVWGIAWATAGDAVWFTALRAGNSEAIYAVTMEGSVRLVHQSTAFLLMADVQRSGEALVMNTTPRMRLECRTKGASETMELSWLDWSLVRDMTPDGRFILFDETGPGGGSEHSVYMRGTDGSPAVRLGDGMAMRFSPDGRWVLAGERIENLGMVLIPTGVGENIPLPTGDFVIHFGEWFPDGKSLCVAAREPGHRLRIYRYDLQRREMKPFTEEGVGRAHAHVSPDGRFIPASGPSGAFALYPTDGGKPQPLDSVGQNERPVRWSEDGASLWVYERSRIPTRIHRVEIATGRREFRMEIAPRYVNGVDSINNVVMTPDGESYAASYTQSLRELYAVRGLR